MNIVSRIERPKTSKRAIAVRWLRQTHGWVGLWGGVLGLMFGTTGFFLTHRAVMRIPSGRPVESNLQVPLPDPLPSTPEALIAFLRQTQNLPGQISHFRAEPAHPVAWGDRSAIQPAHWTGNFGGAHTGVQMEYWAGNRMVSLKRSENGPLATLMNLHKSENVSPFWILLADTMAGSLVFLSLSGIALWVMTHRRQTIAWTLGGGCALVALVLGFGSL